MKRGMIKDQNKIPLLAALFLIVLSIFVGNIKSDHTTENLLRSIIAFMLVPGWILYANKKHLWFRSTFRWVANSSQYYIQSGVIYFVLMLISYEVLLMIPYGLGFFLHLILLSIGSIVYWAPLLIHCSFRKTRPFMHRFTYLLLTLMGFILYHQGSFHYYEAMPTLGFMITGLTTMFCMLLYLVQEWASTESSRDRVTVKGYLRPLSRDR